MFPTLSKVEIIILATFNLSSANAFNLVKLKKKLPFGLELTLSQTSPGFLRVCTSSLLKTLWEKEKLLVTSNFSFSYSVFYRCGELSAIFIKLKIVICKPFQFGRVSNLSFGLDLKPLLPEYCSNV